MTQSNLNIPPGATNAAILQIQAMLQALASSSAGATDPATAYVAFPSQIWSDTANHQVKMRSEANDAWGLMATFDQTYHDFAWVGASMRASRVTGLVLEDSSGTTQVTVGDGTFALKVIGKGSFSDEVAVATATLDTSAVPRGQIKNISPNGTSGVSGSGVTSYAITTGSFTAPSDGTLLAIASMSLTSALGAATLALTASLAGLVPRGSSGAFASSTLPMTSGQSTTVTATGGNANAGYILLGIVLIFVPNT